MALVTGTKPGLVRASTQQRENRGCFPKLAPTLHGPVHVWLGDRGRVLFNPTHALGQVSAPFYRWKLILQAAMSLAHDPLAGKWPRGTPGEVNLPLVLLPEIRSILPHLESRRGKVQRNRKEPRADLFILR